MQQAIQNAAGPAGALAPNIGTDRPMEGALWGQGSELQNAIQDAQKKIEAARRSAKPISAEQLGLALPPAIGEYIQVELKMPSPPPPGDAAAEQVAAANVSANRSSSSTMSNLHGSRVIGTGPHPVPADNSEIRATAPRSLRFSMWKGPPGASIQVWTK